MGCQMSPVHNSGNSPVNDSIGRLPMLSSGQKDHRTGDRWSQNFTYLWLGLSAAQHKSMGAGATRKYRQSARSEAQPIGLSSFQATENAPFGLLH
jgi:hypothetical protein